MRHIWFVSWGYLIPRGIGHWDSQAWLTTHFMEFISLVPTGAIISIWAVLPYWVRLEGRHRRWFSHNERTAERNMWCLPSTALTWGKAYVSCPSHWTMWHATASQEILPDAHRPLGIWMQRRALFQTMHGTLDTETKAVSFDTDNSQQGRHYYHCVTEEETAAGEVSNLPKSNNQWVAEQVWIWVWFQSSDYLPLPSVIMLPHESRPLYVIHAVSLPHFPFWTSHLYLSILQLQVLPQSFIHINWRQTKYTCTKKSVCKFL